MIISYVSYQVQILQLCAATVECGCLSGNLLLTSRTAVPQYMKCYSRNFLAGLTSGGIMQTLKHFLIGGCVVNRLGRH